eukprot:SAG11_NODE_839_length_6916_cov_7.427314_1_plen_93_part_00
MRHHGRQECGYHNDTNPKVRAPNFHVMGTTCSENDPNGPFFDPVHKMYHLFYQDHVSISQNGSDGKPLTGTHGPDWGHAGASIREKCSDFGF